MADAPKYSDKDVRDIIERALKTQGDSGAGLGHGDLLAIGEQVGISPEAMARAARELEQARLDESALGTIKSRRRRWLALHAALFAIINGLLFTVNALTTPGEWWALFPIVVWGLALVLHAAAAFGLGISERTLSKERAKLQPRALGSARDRVRVEGVSRSSEPSAEPREADVDADAVSAKLSR